MRLSNAFLFCIFFFVSSSNIFSAAYSSVTEIKPTGFNNENQFRNLSVTAKVNYTQKKYRLKNAC